MVEASVKLFHHLQIKENLNALLNPLSAFFS
jgi:hypothetical protein